MYLSDKQVGEEATLKRIGGQEEQRLFLSNLGFIPGARVTVVNAADGNLIVKIKESRVALSRAMAERILV